MSKRQKRLTILPEHALNINGARNPRPADPLELACRKAADELHVLLLHALYARTRDDTDMIRKLLDGDDCVIARQTIAVNKAFHAAGLGEPFAP